MLWLWLACGACDDKSADQKPVEQSAGSIHLKPNFEWTGVASEKPSSIVVISLDTVRADRMSIYGGPALTPNIEKLANNGVRFEQAISHFPETALSHWSMLSGQLPEVHGNVPANGGSIYKGPILSEIAKAHDYTTGAFIGGVTLQDSACGMNRGFDVYDDQFQFSPEDMSRPAKEVTANAVKWISKQKGPYFAFVHYFDAHFPYTPPQKWVDKYDPSYAGSIDGSDATLRPYRDGQKTPSARDVQHVLALYDGEISQLDADIAPLLNALGDDVLVVLTSDHGESFEHDYYFNHRAGLWDGVMRVPLIISGGNAPSNRVVSDQVGLMDIAPTVAQVAGLRWDKRMQGRSLQSLMAGAGQGRDVVHSITDPWMPNPQFAARSLSWKWIAQESKNLVYNLETDPSESSPLTDIPPSLSDERQNYKKKIKSLSDHQAEAPKPRDISDDECKQLEALGYTTCSQKTSGAPSNGAVPPRQNAGPSKGPHPNGKPPPFRSPKQQPR